MLKGKSIIELTDVHTGKKEIYEDENLVTEAIFDILNTNIQAFVQLKVPCIDVYRSITQNFSCIIF